MTQEDAPGKLLGNQPIAHGAGNMESRRGGKTLPGEWTVAFSDESAARKVLDSILLEYGLEPTQLHLVASVQLWKIERGYPDGDEQRRSATLFGETRNRDRIGVLFPLDLELASKTAGEASVWNANRMDPIEQTLLQRAEQATVFNLLHEIAHTYMHRAGATERNEVLKQEADADRWAYEHWKRLGFDKRRL